MTQYQEKEREVWCPRCKQYTTVRTYPNPKCKGLSCRLLAEPPQLITVVYSLTTGKRLTGNVKLAK